MNSSAVTRLPRGWVRSSAIAAVALAVGLGALIAQRGRPFGLDDRWMAEVLEKRAPWWDIPALLMDRLGGGLFGALLIPLVIVVALVIARRPMGALVFAVASAASAGVVQLLKAVFGRARPEDILVVSDAGSFPSGHVANAATVAAVIGLLFALRRDRLWVWLLGVVYVFAMAMSRTYLGAHWLTDTLGGALAGVGIALLVWLLFARLLARERGASCQTARLIWVVPQK